MIKMVFAAVSLGLLMMPVTTAPAEAGISIDLNLGKNRISCGRGRRIVDDSGFYDVRTRNCGGRYYDYFAKRRGGRFIVTVDSRRARIVDVRRLYY